MLKSRHRFHGYKTIQRTYGHSKLASGQYISLRYSHRGNEKPYRVAVVVARKVNKSAVTRNKIRRQIYETLRQDLSLPPSYDLVFNIRSDEILSYDHAELTKTLEVLLAKIR